MQKLLSILFQLVLMLALVADSAAADRKERKNEPPLPKPPPQPVQQTVKVRRGEQLTIPLRIYGSQRELLRFLIRKEPASGKLSEPQQRDKESAIVTYEPPADLEVTKDHFSYAVQNSAGVSAAADVVISIVDEPPALIIPDDVKFPPILAGQSNVQEIEIANKGGGMAIGELKVEAPWQIEGPADYRLGAGESKKVKLIFAPTAAGPFRGELLFTSDRARAVALWGEAQAALSAVPPSVLLQAQSGEVIRTGAFELVNGTSEPQTVTLAESPRLMMPKVVELPANGKAVVALHAAVDFVGPLEEVILAKGAGVELRIPVQGKAVGPVLRRLDEQLTFGPVTPGQGAAGTIEVQNVGGAEGYWRWETIAPFSPAEEGVKLAAGERKTLSVRLDPGASGQYRAALRLVGEQQAVDVLAEVNASAGSPPVATRSSVESSRPKFALRRVSATAGSQSGEDDSRTSATGVVPLPSKVKTLEPTRAVVVWPARHYQGAYRLEVRSVGLDAQRKLQIAWSEASSTQVRTDGQRIIGEINELTPNAPYAFRLVNIPPGSDVGTTIGVVQFRTPLKEPLVRFTWLRGLFLLLAVCLGVLAWSRFRRR